MATEAGVHWSRRPRPCAMSEGCAAARVVQRSALVGGTSQALKSITLPKNPQYNKRARNADNNGRTQGDSLLTLPAKLAVGERVERKMID